jgi:hypothetical protein
MIDGEHLEPAMTKEGEAEQSHRDEPETSGTAQTIEVSIVNPIVISTALGNQNN